MVDPTSSLPHPIILAYRRRSTKLLEDLTTTSREFLIKLTSLYDSKILSEAQVLDGWNEFISAHIAPVIGPVIAAPQSQAQHILGVSLEVLRKHLGDAATMKNLRLDLDYSIAPAIVTVQ